MSPKHATDSLPSPPPAPESKTLTKKEKVALFEAWEIADMAARRAQLALDTASEKKSDAAKAIAESLGAGAYTWKGRTRILTSRTNKETGKCTWFFKDPMTQDAEVIG